MSDFLWVCKNCFDEEELHDENDVCVVCGCTEYVPLRSKAIF